MQSQNRFFDDLAKVFNGAAGTMAGMTREAEAAFRDRARDWIGGLEMVSREEFEAVKAMAAAAREENHLLKTRIEALEAKLGGETPKKAAGTRPRRKPGASEGAV
jgi:BMFP domain-containing protein YqiC